MRLLHEVFELIIIKGNDVVENVREGGLMKR